MPGIVDLFRALLHFSSKSATYMWPFLLYCAFLRPTCTLANKINSYFIENKSNLSPLFHNLSAPLATGMSFHNFYLTQHEIFSPVFFLIKIQRKKRYWALKVKNAWLKAFFHLIKGQYLIFSVMIGPVCIFKAKTVKHLHLQCRQEPLPRMKHIIHPLFIFLCPNFQSNQYLVLLLELPLLKYLHLDTGAAYSYEW